MGIEDTATYAYWNSTDKGETFSMVGWVSGKSVKSIVTKRRTAGDMPGRDYRFKREA